MDKVFFCFTVKIKNIYNSKCIYMINKKHIHKLKNPSVVINHFYDIISSYSPNCLDWYESVFFMMSQNIPTWFISCTWLKK